MTKHLRWTVENLLTPLLGFVMAAFLVSACVIGQRTTTAGSGLVSAAVLEKLVEKGRVCQTITDDQLFQPTFRARC